MSKGLLIVDVQNDFCPGGKLAIENGNKVIPVINSLIAVKHFDIIVASQDWHPKNHCSFEQWPEHCVAGTKGAEFHPELNMNNIVAIYRKGYNLKKDSYSIFENYAIPYLDPTILVMELYIVGLAFDVCVKQTALDATNFYRKVYVIKEGCASVFPENEDNIIKELTEKGIKII